MAKKIPVKPNFDLSLIGTFEREEDNNSVWRIVGVRDDGEPKKRHVADFWMDVVSKRCPVEHPDQLDYEVLFRSDTRSVTRVVKAREASDVREFRLAHCSQDFNFFGSADDLLTLNSRILRHAPVPTTYSTARVGVQRHPSTKAWVWVATDKTLDADGNQVTDFTFAGQDEGGKFASNLSPAPLDSAVAERLRTLIFDFNSRRVCVGIVGWFAASFFKPAITERISQWPLAYLIGLAGTGKTSTATLFRDALFGSTTRSPENFYGATPFARTAKNTMSTSYPFLWDEVKPESDATRAKVWRDLVNAAYNNSSVEKGRADLTTISFKHTTPLIATGESRVGDKSTMDRCVTIDFDVNESRQHTHQFKQLVHAAQDLTALGCALLREALRAEVDLLDDMAALIDPRVTDRARHNAAVVLFGAVMVAGLVGSELTAEQLAADVSALFLTDELDGDGGVESEVETVLHYLEQASAINYADSNEDRTVYLWKNYLVRDVHYRKLERVDGQSFSDDEHGVDNQPTAYHLPSCWTRLQAWVREANVPLAYQTYKDFVRQLKSHPRFMKSNYVVKIGGDSRKCLVIAPNK